MNEPAWNKPDYGNWVSKRLIYIPGAISLLFFVLSLALHILIVIAVILLLISIYFIYARHFFSPAGKNMQSRIRDMALDRLDWDGRGNALDIGCGNGPMAIKLARKYPETQVTGLDYWGRMWEYSQSACEKNARIEGVAERVRFQKASASALPFPDDHFDAVVSNLAFHEVRDTRDKREVVREALRVLKKGGRFSFQDVFLFKAVYGDIDELHSTIQSWGVTRVEFVKTGDAPFIPWVLKLPFMTGGLGIFYGEK